mgnify:FL=1
MRWICHIKSVFRKNLLFLYAVSLSFLFVGCLNEGKESSDINLDCGQAVNYVGVNVSDFPSKRFVKIRMVLIGAPMTMDIDKKRATVLYDNKGYIVRADCG